MVRFLNFQLAFHQNWKDFWSNDLMESPRLLLDDGGQVPTRALSFCHIEVDQRLQFVEHELCVPLTDSHCPSRVQQMLKHKDVSAHLLSGFP